MERLIGNIYDALEDDGALAALPELIAEEIGARSCTIQLYASDAALEDMWLSYFLPEMDEFYRENALYPHDDWANAMREIGFDRAERHSDFRPVGSFLDSFFYNEFIRRFGDDSAHCMGFASTRADGGLVVVGMHRGRTQKDFSREQVEMLDAIRPHVSRMLVLRRNLLLREQAATGALAGIDSIEDACLVIRPDRGIVFANASAEALLQEAQLLKSSAGCLELQSRAVDERLTRCLHDVLRLKVEGHAAFVARDRSGQTWRFTLAPKAVEGRTMVLVWIDRAKAGATAPERLQQLYELTSAEVPVLMALSEGRSAQEIADLHSLSVATIRTHIQHIYTKTGVNKASQLATLVAALPKV